MEHHRVVRVVLTGCVLGITLAASAAAADELPMEIDRPDPSAQQQGGPSPDVVLDRLRSREAPRLVGEGPEARRNALAFLDWAASSTSAQAEQVRAMLGEARSNQVVVDTFCGEAFRRQEIDHSGALVALAALGEMRSEAAEDCLIRFARQPLPTEGTKVDGEILEQTALATLQAKAVDGLAYLGTETADQVLLTTVNEHPSRIVRAEAIAAYLWSKDYSEEARRALRESVRDGEEIFVDRPVRRSGDTADTFNPRLEAFVEEHPEVRPPRPEQRAIEPGTITPNPPRP